MVIQSRLASSYLMRRVILTLIFFVFGCWGIYDGWFAWPPQHKRWKEYSEVFVPLEERVRRGESLVGSEQGLYLRLKDEYAKPPRERTEIDIFFQKFVVVPVCFVVAGLFVATWVLAARRRYTYNEDGSLVSPEGAFRADEMTGIDMTRWMSKSIAMLEIKGGPKAGGTAVKLDAWIYAGLEEVIEALNRRFHPEEYQPSTSREETPAPEGHPPVDVSGAPESAQTDEDAAPR